MQNKTRKIGKILSTITLTNIVVALFALTLSFSTTVFADDTKLDPAKIQKLATALDPLKDNPCITEPEKNEGWIVDFMEEPLSLEPQSTDKLKTRICYRNTLRYVGSDNIEKTITELAQGTEENPGCSKAAEELANDPVMRSAYKVSYSCRTIMAILSKGGTSYLEGYIGFIYTWAAGLAGLIAVAVIIISSMQISFAGGESGEIDKAKSRIIKSIAGIAILFLSGVILYTVNPTFFVK
ncbi:hypothetical protein M0P48_04005 [Candidatus Gracilibacteria bacterium]|nr:hypothetical protein [Candidatus Gracilibacteria bacterium]